MKFGDIVTAAAALVVIFILLMAVLFYAMITVSMTYGPDLATILSVLVAGVIVGFLYAGKIREESPMRAIGSIAVLSTVLVMVYTMASLSNPYVPAVLDEELQNMFPTAGWTNIDYLAYAQLLMIMIVSMNMLFALVFGVIGLYLGSRLR